MSTSTDLLSVTSEVALALRDPLYALFSETNMLDKTSESKRLLQTILDEMKTGGQQYTSYFHPNEFVKVILSKGGKDKPELRLHIWEQSRWNEENTRIHNHAWDFWSFILLGEIENITFDRAEGNTYYEYKFQPVSLSDKKYGFHPVGQSNLSVSSRHTMQRNSIYFMRSDVIHTIRPKTPVVATLILQSPFNRVGSEVFSTKELTVEQNSSYAPLSSSEIARYISKLLDSL